MTRSTTSCFPDINVWVAIVVERHVLNRPASAWWNQYQSDAVGFCRFTQLGLLRHLTNGRHDEGKPAHQPSGLEDLNLILKSR